MLNIVKLEMLHEDNNEEVTVQDAYEVKCSTDVAKECFPDIGVCGVHICYGALSWCGYDAKNFFLWFKLYIIRENSHFFSSKILCLYQTTSINQTKSKIDSHS